MNSIVYGFATSIGTSDGELDTTQQMIYAADAYDSCGYSGTRRLIDPTETVLTSNLMAEVQFFSGHGYTNNIQFANSGIIIGESGVSAGKNMIGTDEITMWELSDTKLVSYVACYTAGYKEPETDTCIAYQTAVKGAEVTLGFYDEIVPVSVESWTKRYNERMAAGYGVYESAQYASTFIYLYDSVKKNNTFHHGDANVKIAKTEAFTLIANDIVMKASENRNILKNSIEYDKSKIIETIKENYSKFDINNYEIVISEAPKSTNVISKYEEEVGSYIDLKLKIGDYYTEAGYTIEVKNNKITAIYDNNIDIKKQENALNNKNEFIIYDESIENSLVEKSINTVNEKNKAIDNGKIATEANELIYVYDILNDKKYIHINVKNEKDDGGIVAISYENIKYEIGE